MKLATVHTTLQPHQRRVVDKLKASGGVLQAWGTGSGKGLGYIAAQDALGVPAEYVMPAPLQPNIEKEFLKHTGERPAYTRVQSYEGAVRQPLDTSGLVVFDEAHRGRNPGTGAASLLRQARDAPYRLLGTATPVYNQAEDLANLLNTAAGSNVVPSGRDFRSTFVGEKTIKPGFVNRLRGMQPMTVPVLKNKAKLVDAATGYVDVHKGGTGPDFPRRVDESFDVPMSDEQHKLYRHFIGALPWYLRAKIQSGLPMSKRESKELNAFQGALRITSNTPRPYVAAMTDEEELRHTSKINAAVENLKKLRATNPNARAVVYSNYLSGGLDPYARQLAAAGIPHAKFTGETAPKDRARLVQEYNSGKTPVMLISGAGSEGLDLKGTSVVQALDPHWNQSRIEQAVGRGIRYKSHEHLPEDQREVRVQKYYSTLPPSLLNRMGVGKPKGAIDHYLRDMSAQKGELRGQIMAALQEASDRGPLQAKTSGAPPLDVAKLTRIITTPYRPYRKAALGAGALAALATGTYGVHKWLTRRDEEKTAASEEWVRRMLARRTWDCLRPHPPRHPCP